MLARTEQLLSQLKAAADPVRLRLLALCRHGECSVSELTGVLGQSQPRISQQLKVLCDAGLLERFRDGQRRYYRWPAGGRDGASRRQLLRLLPDDEPQFADDANRLRRLRASNGGEEAPASASDRALHRAIMDLTVTAPVGDLLDIGCGRGALLKLLSSRANQAVGVDIDAGVRDLARNELLLAGLQNCSLRKGDMYHLPFAEHSYDTIILDDVLRTAERPLAALQEAARVLRPGGRLLLLLRVIGGDAARQQADMAAWCAEAGLRLTPSRLVPRNQPAWMLAVACPTEAHQHTTAAA
jgi:SAM-dependent methyltransferase